MDIQTHHTNVKYNLKIIIYSFDSAVQSAATSQTLAVQAIMLPVSVDAIIIKNNTKLATQPEIQKL